MLALWPSRWLAWSGLLTAILTLAATTSAWPEVTTCTGTLAAVNVDNLIIPNGASCTLVDGTVGNLEAHDAASVLLIGTVIFRNATFSGTTSAILVGPQITGNVDVRDNGTVSFLGGNYDKNVTAANNGKLTFVGPEIKGNVEVTEISRHSPS